MKRLPWLVLLGACAVGACRPKANTDVRTMDVRRANGPITIDGRLSEPDWRHAERTGALIDTLTGAVGLPRSAQGEVRALWTERALFLAWSVADDHRIDRGVGQVDPHLWEDDCAEVMLDPGGDERDYYELQVGPSNSVFDTMYRTPRVPRPFGMTEWTAHVESAVVASPEGYVVEMAIPWSSVGVASPSPATVLRGNFYLMDRTRDGQKFAGWSAPMVGDFHVPARFGHLRLRN